MYKNIQHEYKVVSYKYYKAWVQVKMNNTRSAEGPRWSTIVSWMVAKNSIVIVGSTVLYSFFFVLYDARTDVVWQ